MVIVDLNQVMISNMMAQLRGHVTDIDEGLLRHMILNTLRFNRQKFHEEFGELVIACDDKNYWRREVFPYYKAGRRKHREESDLDWPKIFESLNKVRDELREFFPYPVIQVDTCEADDIIATLVKFNTNEPILILSGDKDFIQLQTQTNVRQYDPTRKRWLKNGNPKRYLIEHVIRGDAGDGVPNILSADDTFVSDSRQKPLYQKRLHAWTEDILSGESIDKVLGPSYYRNFMRNQKMIDLNEIPSGKETEILEMMESQQDKGREKLFNYFVKNKLRNLMDSLQEF